MSILDRVRVFHWFSWSHWGQFREPLLICPEFLTWGMHDVDDEDIEYLALTRPHREAGQ